MKKQKVIRTPEDLETLYCPAEESQGVPAGVSKGKIGTKLVKYTVKCRESISGIVIHTWGQVGKKRYQPFPCYGEYLAAQRAAHKRPPKGLAWQLMINEPEWIFDKTELEKWRKTHNPRLMGTAVSDHPHKEFNSKWLKELEPNSDGTTEGLIKKTKKGCFTYLTICAQEEIHGPYFWAAGYCEGSEADFMPIEVPFPCTLEEIRSAVKEAKDQSEEEWNRTHACENCGDEEWGMYDREINPSCETCKGEGFFL
jgi:hypothetical protein